MVFKTREILEHIIHTEKWPTNTREIEMDVTRILHFEEWLSYQIMKREELRPAWGVANTTSSGVSGGAQG